MTIALANRNMPNDTGWQDRHDDAIRYPRQAERPIVGMLNAWVLYASQHRDRYDSLIGDDAVLGEHWQAIGEAILGLLNGETGRLDCGTLATFISDTLRNNGVEVDQ